MKITLHDVVIGVLIIAIGVIVIGVSLFIGAVTAVLGIILIIFGFGMPAFPSHVNAKKTEASIRYQWFIEEGNRRIQEGKFLIDKKVFDEKSRAISDVVSNSSRLPEFGIDAVYIYYPDSESAAGARQKVISKGVSADIQEDKNGWILKIKFE
ncbi:MAG: hypothetical protein ACP5UV_04105 [Thermoplasmata archaeon]